MAYELTYTPRFQKHFKGLSSHPSLRTKRIQGTTDLFECSVNMDIRIIWYYEGSKMIILLDVGHHDILKQF